MVFFVVISFWFAFYMVSLFLGIIAMSYEEEKQITAENAKKTEPKFQQTSKELQEGNGATEVYIFLVLLRITEVELPSIGLRLHCLLLETRYLCST